MSEWFDIPESKEEKDNKQKKVRPYRIGMVGSQKYESRQKIKDLIFKLKQKYKDIDFTIISGGRTNGADTYVKKYTLEFGCDYKEFNPAHTVKNLYSVLHDNYYGKNYSVRYFFQRNSMMIDYVDYLIIFVTEPIDKDIEHVIKEVKRKEKKFIILT